MVPQAPLAPWTATAPTGSSMWHLRSRNSTTTTTSTPATAPMTMEPRPETVLHPAVMATRPAREALRHMDTSGLPFLHQVRAMHTTVAMAGARVVVAKILASSSMEPAAAPLKPYQPNQRMNTPKAPRGRLWAGMALETFLPFFFVYLPIRGPRKMAPSRAQTPPAMWITQEPAKSIKPRLASHPPSPQAQPASMG